MIRPGIGYIRLGSFGLTSHKEVTIAMDSLKKKGMKDFIRGIIEDIQGGFENSRGKYVDRYDVYGMIVKRFLCEGDTKKRNFHIYYSDGKAYSKK